MSLFHITYRDGNEALSCFISRSSLQIITKTFLFSAFFLYATKSFSSSPQTTSMTVQATVIATCSVSAGTLNFGNYNVLTATPTDSTATVSVICTSGVPYVVSLNQGAGSGATVANRLMTSSGNTLSYGIYTANTYASNQIWGDGTSGTVTQSNTGSGISQPFTAYGRIPAQQNVPTGTYTDSVTVTVTF